VFGVLDACSAMLCDRFFDRANGVRHNFHP
jgi:hypothetical protein